MAASNTAEIFNQLFGTFTTLAVIVGVVVFGLMAYLLVRYRARESLPEPGDAPQLGRLPQPRGHLKTVLVSVALSSIILGVLIFGTLAANYQITTIPAECQPNTDQFPGQCVFIRVKAFRFGWNFTYANGVTLRGNLTIPIDRIVVLEISSKDVFHSFGIDSFKLKKDAIPGLPNRIWFIATEDGTRLNGIRCFELCGVGHAGMTANLKVGQSVCSGSGC